MLTFRTACADELPRIVEIYNQTIPGRMVTADLEPVTVSQRESWFAEHDERHPLVSVFFGENLCGWYSFQKYHPRAAYNVSAELSLYLDEAFRGRGIGSAIMEHALAAAQTLGYENILGLVFGHNIPSLSLFEKYGFARWGTLPGVARLDGIARDLVIMGKKIR